MKSFEVSKSVDPVNVLSKNSTGEVQAQALYVPVAALPVYVLAWYSAAVAYGLYAWVGVKKYVV